MFQQDKFADRDVITLVEGFGELPGAGLPGMIEVHQRE